MSTEFYNFPHTDIATGKALQMETSLPVLLEAHRSQKREIPEFVRRFHPNENRWVQSMLPVQMWPATPSFLTCPSGPEKGHVA